MKTRLALPFLVALTVGFRLVSSIEAQIVNGSFRGMSRTNLELLLLKPPLSSMSLPEGFPGKRPPTKRGRTSSPICLQESMTLLSRYKVSKHW